MINSHIRQLLAPRMIRSRRRTLSAADDVHPIQPLRRCVSSAWGVFRMAHKIRRRASTGGYPAVKLVRIESLQQLLDGLPAHFENDASRDAIRKRIVLVAMLELDEKEIVMIVRSVARAQQSPAFVKLGFSSTTEIHDGRTQAVSSAQIQSISPSRATSGSIVSATW
jgi:hypothetical protein